VGSDCFKIFRGLSPTSRQAGISESNAKSPLSTREALTLGCVRLASPVFNSINNHMPRVIKFLDPQSADRTPSPYTPDNNTQDTHQGKDHQSYPQPSMSLSVQVSDCHMRRNNQSHPLIPKAHSLHAPNRPPLYLTNVRWQFRLL